MESEVPLKKEEEEKCCTPGESALSPAKLEHKTCISVNKFSMSHPVFHDFDKACATSNTIFPYKMALYIGNYSDTVLRIARCRGFNRLEIKDDDPLDSLDFIWKPTNFSARFYSRIDKANSTRITKQHIVVNHLEHLKGLCTKTGLVKSLRRYYKHNLEAILAHYGVYDSTPTTYVVSSSCADAEYAAFSVYFHDNESQIGRKDLPPKQVAENIWLVKPAAENQGRGIEIFKNDLPGIKKFLLSKPANSSWVIQKYIEHPLLYQGRKFDIRVWAVITWKKELFYYRIGYIRTSSHHYSLDTGLNYVHLTNNCLQQYGDKYGAFEEGNTISYEIFKEFLAKQYPDINIDFEKDIVPRMKDLMIDTYLANKYELNPNRRKNCFEFLGYDFLIDEDFRVWLIEVNTNPYIGIPNEYIEGVLPKMLNSLLELVVDPYLPPANKLPSAEVSNQFEVLYSEKNNIKFIIVAFLLK